jgi:hypothetical protein
VKVAARKVPVGVGQGAVGIGAVAQVPGDHPEAAGIELLGGLDQDRLGGADRLAADLLRRAGDEGGVLVAQVALREGGVGLGELGEPARQAQALGGRPRREAALPAQPADQAEGTLGGVPAGGIEAAQAVGENGFQPVEALPQRHQFLAQGGIREVADPGVQPVEELGEWSFRLTGRTHVRMIAQNHRNVQKLMFGRS